MVNSSRQIVSGASVRPGYTRTQGNPGMLVQTHMMMVGCSWRRTDLSLARRQPVFSATGRLTTASTAFRAVTVGGTMTAQHEERLRQRFSGIAAVCACLKELCFTVSFSTYVPHQQVEFH